MTRIAVLGPIPRDTIYTYQNEKIQKYGCVTHPTIALAKLLEESGEVIPVSHVHKKDYQGILKVFKPYGNIDISNINDAEDRDRYDILYKPYNQIELAKRIRSALDKHNEQP